MKFYKKKLARNRAGGAHELVAIGDIHGALNGLLEMLVHAGLIDRRMHWKGGGKTLVQMGDVVDRGPHFFEANELLAALQDEAEEKDGKVVRLIGNHELELIKGNLFVTTLPQAEAEDYRQRLLKDIMNRRLVGAYAEQGYLFTHAGLTGKMQELLSAESGPLELNELGYAAIINEIVYAAVRNADFRHPIFNIGISRGGPARYGGIFWEDIKEMMASRWSPPMRQVIGHTPMSSIIKAHDGAVVAIDVGLYRNNTKAYIRIRNGRVKAVTLNKKN